MLKQHQVARIAERLAAGDSQREASRATGHARKTVRSIALSEHPLQLRAARGEIAPAPALSEARVRAILAAAGEALEPLGMELQSLDHVRYLLHRKLSIRREAVE
jgi:trimethylamine:corrinoid methyltransferase-like protein